MTQQGAYERSGVSIARGDAASADAYKQLSKTFTDSTQVVSGIVGVKADFGEMNNPVLAMAVDGVGTKLKYAFASGKHSTVGIDLVAMCVNDLARNNITPLGFALYRATGRIEEQVMHDVVEGVVEGCRQAGCTYQTGETAEMPDFYSAGEYDLAGCALGVFDEPGLLTGEEIEEGDVVFGLPSSGPHSNGFSLIRKLFPPEEVIADEELLRQILEPTRIYVGTVLALNRKFEIHGWSHITGGGIVGKLGKTIPDGLQASIRLGSWDIPQIFQKIQERAEITDEEMRDIFNLGLGMIGVAPKGAFGEITDFLSNLREPVRFLGWVKKDDGRRKVAFN